MSGIELKPHSPEFKEQTPVKRFCDAPECRCEGEFRAPKSRYDLTDYYWFCLDHVREYNKQWDFCEGMTPAQINLMINAVATWDRPTRKIVPIAGFDPDALRDAVYRDFAFSDKGYYDFKPNEERQNFSEGEWSIPETPSQELDALAIMGLEPPVTLEDIKERYKLLAKKYHPDLNGANADAEDLLKKINISYSILKVAYQKYEALDQ